MGVEVEGVPSLAGEIASAQAELVLAGQAASIRRDPGVSLYLATQVRVLGLLGRVVEQIRSKDDFARMEGEIQHALRLIGGEVARGVEAGAHTGMRQEANRMIRRLDRGLSVRIGLAIGAALVLGAAGAVGVLYAAGAGPLSSSGLAAQRWAELQRCNPYPQNAKPVANGSRTVVMLWDKCDEQPK